MSYTAHNELQTKAFEAIEALNTCRNEYMETGSTDTEGNYHFRQLIFNIFGNEFTSPTSIEETGLLPVTADDWELYTCGDLKFLCEKAAREFAKHINNILDIAKELYNLNYGSWSFRAEAISNRYNG